MAAAAEVLEKVDVLGPPPAQINLEADFEKVPPPPPPFDPVQLKEKYIAERDKRLKHGGGINQYRLVETDGIFAHMLKDPWTKPGFTREPISEQVDVMIVGGGYGAQLVAVRLIEHGVTNIRMIEKAGDFGGTWYWNRYAVDQSRGCHQHIWTCQQLLRPHANVTSSIRYPGAQCDIESVSLGCQIIRTRVCLI